MDVQTQIIQQKRLNEQFSNKITINETILLKKIALIKKYYAQIKKSWIFFNTQSFDTKIIEKNIFQLFFSTKFYQGTKKTQFQGFDYIIYQSNFKIVCKKKQNKAKYAQDSEENLSGLEKIEESLEKISEIYEYHYFGQILNIQTEQSNLNNQAIINETQKINFHGYGLLINFDPKINLNDTKEKSQEYLINCYFGQFINGFKHGYGMEFKQNSGSKHTIQIYMGNFINGNYDDEEAIWIKIKISNQNSSIQQQNQNLILEYLDKYYGIFVNGKKHGKGQMSSFELYYDGDWRFDKPEGSGELWTSNSYYKGRFKSGLKHLRGKQFFKNGDIYEGNYSNNKPGGYGKYFWKNSSFYEGEFKNGLRDGKGLWKFGSESFEGNYVNDKKSGQGIYYWNDGQTYYKGNFYEDLRHGYGQMYWDNRTSIYKGQWKQGFQNGYGQIYQVQSDTNVTKMIKKGQFSKGHMIQQIMEENQISMSISQHKRETVDSNQLNVKGEKNQQLQSINKIPKVGNIILAKSKGVVLNRQKHKKYQIDQQIEVKDNNQHLKNQTNRRQQKRFIKSQNNNYNQKIQKQGFQKIIKIKNRYPIDDTKDPVDRQHLYGSVYLIKSGRKKLGSSVQNIQNLSSPNVQQNSMKNIPQTSNKSIPKINKNYRSSSFSTNPPLLKKVRENQTNDKLQKIDIKNKNHKYFGTDKSKKLTNFNKDNQSKQQFILPKRSALSTNKQYSFRYFDAEQQKNFIQLQPLIVWNNFFRHSKRRSFLK